MHGLENGDKFTALSAKEKSLKKMRTGFAQLHIDRRRSPTAIQMTSFSRTVLCIYFALSIFEPYINGMLGSVTKYYIFFTMLVLLYQYHWKLYPTKASKAFAVWLIYKIISLAWSQDYATPRLHFISQIGMVMFLFVLFSYDYDEDTLDWIEITYWLSCAAIGLLSMFFSRSYLGTVVSRQVLVIAGVEVDPNNQAALLMVGICVSLVNLFFRKRWRLPSVLILLINTYGCFLTGSRAAIATILIAVLFCVMLPGEKKKISAIVGRVILVVLFFTAALYLAQRLNATIYNRLFNLQGYAGGSGRSQQWANVWRLYTSNILSVFFGVGWGTSTIYTGAYAQNGTSLGVHNTFLTMLCDVGLIGTLVFLAPIFVMASRLIRKRIHFPVMLLVIQFVPAFFIDAINKRFFWNAIFLLGMYYYHFIRNSGEDIATRFSYSVGEER